jgi:hypothetical protein
VDVYFVENATASAFPVACCRELQIPGKSIYLSMMVPGSYEINTLNNEKCEMINVK